jgi:large subunit ribosomal protein L18
MKKKNAVVFFRRKREGRTDYLRRLSLLKSRKLRLVVRKTNKHLILQVVEYRPDGDHVLTTVSTQHLVKQGWKAATSNSAAAYLTGKLLAKQLKAQGEIIVDIGLQTHNKGSRIYAAVRGVKDGGVAVKCSDDVLSDDSRLSGEHLSEAVRKQFAIFKEKL